MGFSESDSVSSTLHLINTDAPVDWEWVYRANVVSIYRLMYSKVGNQAGAAAPARDPSAWRAN